MKRLVDKAAGMGGNAVIDADFETNDILQGKATLFSTYFTAVVIE